VGPGFLKNRPMVSPACRKRRLIGVCTSFDFTWPEILELKVKLDNFMALFIGSLYNC
jgi:hypothetical protein